MISVSRVPFRWLVLLLLTPLAAAAAERERLRDLPYRAEAEGREDAYLRERCVLDIDRPLGVEGFATIVWFHGGGLEGGEKELPAELLASGHAVVAPNYRLAPVVKAETAISDAAAAVAWVFRHIEEHGGDPDQVFVAGHSAGGYLALMVGLDRSLLAAHEIDADQIAGLIPLSGHAVTHFAIRRERGIPGHQAVIDLHAPLFHVRADAPPLLLITGDRERELLGRYEENAYLMRMMRVAGHEATRLIELGGYGHDMARPAYPLLLEEVARVLAARAD